MAQEKQNAEGTIKKCVFFNGANFVNATKFHKNNIFKRKKNTHSDLIIVLVKKF